MTWQATEGLLYRVSSIKIERGDRTTAAILGLDLDGTLIDSKVGSVSPTDWQLRFAKAGAVLAAYQKAGWHLVIFSNQKGLMGLGAAKGAHPALSGKAGKEGKRQEQFMQRVEAVLKALGIDMDVMVATGDEKSEYRKPGIGMMKAWTALLLQGYTSYSGYFVGDAAGPGAVNPKYRWSDSDRKFAEATGLTFKLPEEVLG